MVIDEPVPLANTGVWMGLMVLPDSTALAELNMALDASAPLGASRRVSWLDAAEQQNHGGQVYIYDSLHTKFPLIQSRRRVGSGQFPLGCQMPAVEWIECHLS